MAGFTNTTPPSLSGSKAVGGTVTADPGVWSPTPADYTYAWERADDASGTNRTLISGATGGTYTISAFDTGKYLRVGVYPIEQTVVATNRFGISTGFPISYWTTAQRNAYYAAIRSAGFTRVRFDYSSATPGGLTDLHVQSAVAAGLQIRLMIGGTPSDTGSSYSTRCTACVNYFKTWVSEFELMNEPNIASNPAWANGAAYAAVAKVGSAAIKAAMTTATVILGAISNFGVHGDTSVKAPENWLASVYAQGNSWFDHVDYHPYGFGTNYTGLQAFQNPAGWTIMQYLRAIMVTNGDTAKKIHVSEHGAPTFLAADWPQGSSQSMSEQAQADFLSLSINDLKATSYLGDLYIYSFRDRAPDEQTGNREGHFGIILNTSATPGSDTPKIAYGVVTGLIV